MLDNELIKKYHLEEEKKRFDQILEYTFMTKPVISEDDEESDEDSNNGKENDGQDALGKDDEISGESESDADNVEPASPDNVDNNDDDSESDIPDNGMENGMTDDSNEMPDVDGQDNPELPSDDFSQETEEMQDGDEVIDVDDLTKAQEDSEMKIDGVNDTLTNLLSVVNKFAKAIEINDKNIQDLKSEFEKRNPTDDEKLNIRSQSSYPYSVKPKDYWEGKKGSNYDVKFDNETPANKEQEYTFTKDELRGMNDRSIADTLDDFKLKDYIDF